MRSRINTINCVFKQGALVGKGKVILITLDFIHHCPLILEIKIFYIYFSALCSLFPWELHHVALG